MTGPLQAYHVLPGLAASNPARTTSPAAAVQAALSRGLSTTVQIVGDSTGVLVGDQTAPYTPWPILLGQKIAALYPTYNVKIRQWNSTTQWYDLPTVIQAGPSGDSKITASGSAMLRYAGANVATDLDVRMKLAPTAWVPASSNVCAGKYVSGTNQRSWYLGISNLGKIYLTWFTDGTAATQVQKFSTVATGFTGSQVGWIRATLDVDNGATGSDVKFYTSTDGVTWTQLGTTVTTAGVTSIFASTASYQLCSLDTTAGSVCTGDYYWVEVRDGLTNGVSLVPPQPDTWDQASLSSTGTIARGGSPTLMIVNGSEGGQNLVYWSNATRKSHVLSPHAAHMVITNDGHNEAFATVDVWQATLTAWQDIVAALLPNVPGVYLTQNPQKSPQVQNDIDTRARRGLLLLAWVHSQPGLYGIDTYQVFTQPSTQVSSDGVHPNLVGAQAEADYLYRTLF